MLRYNELTCFYFIFFTGALPLGPTTGESGAFAFLYLRHQLRLTESLLEVLRLCAFKKHTVLCENQLMVLSIIQTSRFRLLALV